MVSKVCTSCGSVNAPDDAFCAKCGSKLEGTVSGSAGRPEHSLTPNHGQAHYAPVMLPAWLTFGMIVVLLSGLLILMGFMIFVVGTASLGSTTTLDSLKSYLEEFAALAGVGFFLAPIGWALHQASLHRRRS